MGSFISSERCASDYGTTLNCTVGYSADRLTVLSLGNIKPGEFDGDPDIAGAGVSLP